MSRKSEVGAAYARGENTSLIAEKHGISRQRVEQIARELGLPHRHPLKGKAGGRGNPADLLARWAREAEERKAARKRARDGRAA